jgi:hypothetical protein
MMAGWQPKSPHVSQLRQNPDGSYAGDDDCGPASCTRYLREAGKLDPTVPSLQQFNDCREWINGQPDQEFQSGTGITDLEGWIGHFGIDTFWTTDFTVTKGSAFGIVLINAVPKLVDGSWPYDSSWLGNAEHWILWLRELNGAINWFNDPLTYLGGERDTQLDLDYLAGVFVGAIVLPDIPNPPTPVPQAPVFMHTKSAAALKVQPNHTCTALARMPAGGNVLVHTGRTQTTNNELWQYVQYSDKQGWVLANNLTVYTV